MIRIIRSKKIKKILNVVEKSSVKILLNIKLIIINIGNLNLNLKYIVIKINIIIWIIDLYKPFNEICHKIF